MNHNNIYSILGKLHALDPQAKTSLQLNESVETIVDDSGKVESRLMQEYNAIKEAKTQDKKDAKKKADKKKVKESTEKIIELVEGVMAPTDLADYKEKRAHLQQLQMDRVIATQPEIKNAVMKALADLNAAAAARGIPVQEEVVDEADGPRKAGYGTYGTEYQGDSDTDPDLNPEVKRGRGRPRTKAAKVPTGKIGRPTVNKSTHTATGLNSVMGKKKLGEKAPAIRKPKQEVPKGSGSAYNVGWSKYKEKAHKSESFARFDRELQKHLNESKSMLTEGAIKELFTTLIDQLEGSEPGYSIMDAWNNGDNRAGEQIIRRTVNHSEPFHKLSHSMKEQLVDAALEHYFDSGEGDTEPADLTNFNPDAELTDAIEPPVVTELDELAKLAGLPAASNNPSSAAPARGVIDEVWDDEAGYDTSDPKHPGQAERQADQADFARDQRRHGDFLPQSDLEEVRQDPNFDDPDGDAWEEDLINKSHRAGLPWDREQGGYGDPELDGNDDLTELAKLAGLTVDEAYEYGDVGDTRDEKVHLDNTPDELIMGADVLTKGGDGEVAGQEMNMMKGGSARFSDNPLTADKADKKKVKETFDPYASLSSDLMQEYEGIKLKSEN